MLSELDDKNLLVHLTDGLNPCFNGICSLSGEELVGKTDKFRLS